MQKIILIVDDQNKLRTIYKKALLLNQYEVLEAVNAKTAVDILSEHKDIDLVLLDINMPELDGVALYEWIRRLKHRAKVIVTSAYLIVEQRKMIADADDYYDKSHSIEELIEKIRKAIGE